MTFIGRTARIGLAFVGAATVALAPLPAIAAPVAADAPTQPAGVVLEWGLNALQQLPSNNGACAYFTAGTTDGTEATYSAQSGNVKIIKRLANGSAIVPTKATRCDAVAGSSVNQAFRFEHGTSTLNAAGTSGSLSWQGAATINSYGGMVPWSISNPRLELNNGVGTLSADVIAYAVDPGRPDTKTPLPPTSGVVLAVLDQASVKDGKVSGIPRFDNVDYFPLNDPANPTSGRAKVSAIPAAAKSGRWGSWPQSLVDVHYRTGLTSYWHTSAAGDAANKEPTVPTILLNAADDNNSTLTPVRVATPPRDVEAVTGNQVTLNVTAEGTSPTYQWQKSVDRQWQDVPGATAASLTIHGAKDNSGYYRVVISNSLSSVNSSSANVDIRDAEPLALGWAPKAQTLFQGQRLWITGYASGFPTPVQTPEVSHDDGKTWQAAGSPEQGARFFMKENIGTDWNGALYRFTATIPQTATASRAVGPQATTFTSEPVRITVLTAPKTPTLILNPNEVAPGKQFEPGTGDRVEVIGAGFPGSPETQFGLVRTEAWKAWKESGTDFEEGDVAWSSVIKAEWNQFDGGVFSRGTGQSAGDMKTGQAYSVFVRATDGSHSMDAAVSVPFVGDAPVIEPSIEPSATSTAEPTATATATSEPSATSTAEPTATATGTATSTPTGSSTPEPGGTTTPSVQPTASTGEPIAAVSAAASSTPVASAPESPTATATEAGELATTGVNQSLGLVAALGVVLCAVGLIAVRRRSRH